MTYKPQVFIGTLFCGENDFSQCCAAIIQQNGITFRHDVIANLPEKEAHNKLWSTWRSIQRDFDAFIKIDADTVLAHDNVIIEFMNIMMNNKDVTGIQAPLHDYFTDTFINGLNCFKNSVIFNDSRDDLYCDRNIDINHKIVLKADKVPTSLRPAGFHCHHASESQAYHYGLHRMLKGQTETISLVKKAFLKNNDKLRGLALLGASDAEQFRTQRKFNYADVEFQTSFANATSNYDTLISRITI